MAEKTFHSITLPGQDTARVPLTAAEFSTSVAYQVKDYCTYQGKLYRCITAHAAGAWNAAHFTATDVDAEFDRKLDIPASQASAPANPRVGDLWIDNDENSPIYNVDASPTLNSTNAVQSGGTKVALNSLDSRKMEHGVITGDFSASVDYRIGDLVFYATTANGITTRTLYRCTTDHNATAWNAAHFTATTLEVELQRIRESEADTDMIGDLFGSKSTYAVGDYCIYNDNLYRCIQVVDNTGVTTPAFDPDDWTQVALADDVSDLKNAINDIYDENRKRIFPVWEHGYIDTSTGADKYDGSTALSRTDYIKASELSYYHNPYAKDSYVFYYTKSGDVYTYANINKYVRNAWHFINPYGDYYVRIAFYGGFDDAKGCEFFSKETNLHYAEKGLPLLEGLVNSQYIYTKITPNIDSNYQNRFLDINGNAISDALYANLFDVSEPIPVGDEDAIMYPYDMIIDGCYIGFYSGTNLDTMVKMIQGECKAGTVVAIPTGAKYFRITVKKTDEFACYKVKLTDTSLTLPNKSADSKAVGNAISGLPGLEEDNAKIVIRNLVNPSDIVAGHYMQPEHTEYSENSLYQATGYMNVIPGNTYYFYTGTTSKTCYFVAVYDSYKNPVIGKGGSNMSSYTVTDGEAYIICSFATTDTNLCVIAESSLSEFIEYGVIKISKDVLPESQTGEDKPNYLSGTTYLSDIKQALKKNVIVTYFATFSAFTSLKIGFTQTDDYTTGYTNYFEITDTNFIMHRKNVSDQSWAHGMTIADYIGVTLSFDKDKHCTVDVITNGGAYTKENTIFEGWKYYPFAVASGTSVENEKLSMACKDFRKNVLLFGDSYFGYSTKGWMYYLGDEVYENLCINGLAGESSTGAFTDLNVLRDFASPKYIVWCLGMNDGSDTNDTTPNATWLSNEQSVISYCESHEIIPVLATIPSVPAAGSRAARNHKGKSAWVRASGYKYIDFAKAVENPEYDPQTDEPIDMWYSGMLNAGTEQSPDLMHPDVEGAKALCARAITDFPQLLVPSD